MLRVEFIPKGTFIIEYTGEVISTNEAEVVEPFTILESEARRGRHTKGQHLKVHQPLEDSNVKQKLMVVSGDHRIGLFASKDIQAEEERIRCRSTRKQRPKREFHRMIGVVRPPISFLSLITRRKRQKHPLQITRIGTQSRNMPQNMPEFHRIFRFDR
ncbi:hypothetical protein L596_013515 [Steinernema carpocapsae]|uniref:SET domain-containing protein n=1 Tax=Steinernema carpocapsae TaxID=34508 RepID=A0A4U5P0D9_STECR|nr:hypothetical protein L596_013515 [Steinernema carpocapsae]